MSAGRRASTTWSRTNSTGLLTVAAGTKALLTAFSLNNVGIGETVRRTHVQLYVQSDQAVSPEVHIGALGFVIATDAALAAGAASIPGPVTDASDDGWFVWMPFQDVGIIGGQQRGNINEWEVDSKAMRKIQEGYGIAVMIENASAVVGGIDVMIAISMLTSIS